MAISLYQYLIHHDLEEVVREWDNPELDMEEIPYNYKEKVNWKCGRGHHYVMGIESKLLGAMCPECAFYKKTSISEKAIYYYVKKAFPDTLCNVKTEWLGKREMDIFIPSISVVVEYDGDYFHQDPKRDIAKDKLCLEHGIEVIRLRDQTAPFLKSTSKIILVDNLNKGFEHLDRPITELMNYLCKTYHKKKHFLLVDVDSHFDEILQLVEDYLNSKSLLTTYPHLLKEWDTKKNIDLDPACFSYGSRLKVWWNCEKGHSYECQISHRTLDHQGCPYCSNHRVLAGFNDLATTYPSIAAKWDEEKNGSKKATMFTFGSRELVWWKCNLGHSYSCKIYHRTLDGVGCPYCASKKVYKGFNDLKTKYPLVAKYYDESKNELKACEVMPGSNKIVWWTCDNHHSFQMMIKSRVKRIGACPICDKNK